VTKAYVTRVGEGPFPSEDRGSDGLEMVNRGKEYGATTGRQRRCGWFDAVIGRYATRLNSLTEIFLTKVDVLSSFDTIKICTAYEYNGQKYENFPPHQTIFHKAKPIFEEMPGWRTDISGARTWDDLPEKAQNYIRRLEELCDVPVTDISVGPEATETVARRG
jgi:adenylosuccinate synthase